MDRNGNAENNRHKTRQSTNDHAPPTGTAGIPYFNAALGGTGPGMGSVWADL